VDTLIEKIVLAVLRSDEDRPQAKGLRAFPTNRAVSGPCLSENDNDLIRKGFIFPKLRRRKVVRAPELNLVVYFHPICPSDIFVMFTNFADELGHHPSSSSWRLP